MDILDKILSKLEKVKQLSSGRYQACCPLHDDKTPSLSITKKNGKTLIYCHAGCDTGDIITFLGFTWDDLNDNEKEKYSNTNYSKKDFYTLEEIEKKTEAIYKYRDEQNQLYIMVVRFPGKKFAQYSYIGSDNWQLGLKGKKPILYRLPELIDAIENGLIIFIVEGEKDVENLKKIGLTATTCPMGAGKWKKDYSQYFKDAIVVIIPDNDSPGRQHARHIANELIDIAQEVRILYLPNLQEKQDISDWLRAGGTKEELIDIIENTPLWIKEEEIKDFQQPSQQWEFYTDLWNSDRFAERHGENIRYCYPWGTWLIWNEKQWEIDKEGDIYERAKETVRSYYVKASEILDDERRSKLIKHAQASESLNRIRAMTILSESSIPILPEVLDKDK